MTRAKTMLQLIAIVLPALVLVSAVSLGGLAYWARPTMIVQNDSESTVQVTAYWDEHEKVLQPIKPGARQTFKVSGESAIVFVVTHPDGTQVRSHPMYFTAATTVTAMFTGNAVEVTSAL